MLWTAIGFLAFYAIEKLTTLHVGHETAAELDHDEAMHTHVGTAGAIGMGIHSFLDGIALAAGLAVGGGTAIVIAVVVIVHRFSDGIGVVSFLLASRVPSTTAYRWLTLVAIAPVAGVLVGVADPDRADALGRGPRLLRGLLPLRRRRGAAARGASPRPVALDRARHDRRRGGDLPVLGGGRRDRGRGALSDEGPQRAAGDHRPRGGLKPFRPRCLGWVDTIRPEHPMATATPARSGPPFRLTLRGTAILVALLGLLLVYATDQILPASTDRQAELRFWLAARATGIVAFLLLTMQIVLGLVLSHPTNRSTWNLSKRIFPWHDHLWVFVLAFLIAHIVSLVVDPKAGVSLAGAFIPGLSEYRSSPVAIGTLALYAFLVTAITRALDEAPAARRLADDPPPGAGDLGDGLDARRARRARTPARWPLLYVAAGLFVVGAGRLSLLGQPQAEADVLDVATRRSPADEDHLAPLAAPAHDRRGRRGAGPRLRLDPGRRRLDRRVGAHRRRAHPGQLDPGPPRPGDGRSEAMRAQLDSLASQSTEMTTALEAAQARIAADTAHAKALADELKAAKQKLAKLEASIAAAKAAAARSVATTTGGDARDGADPDPPWRR